MKRIIGTFLLAVGFWGCAGAYPKGEWLVGYHPGVTLAQRDSLAVHYGLTVISRLSDLPVDQVLLPKEELADSLGHCPLVDYVERNWSGSVKSIPSDSLYSQQWHLSRINAPAAWDSTPGDSRVVVAVIDAGMDTSHVDLRGKLWLNPNEICDNGMDDDGNGYKDDCRGWNFAAGFVGSPDVYDATSGSAAGHGTHVAGIVAAQTDNQVGIAAVGYHTTVLPLKIFSANSTGGTVTQVVNAIGYATKTPGVRVINLSLQLAGYSITVERAVEAARTKGILVVCSAGNSGKNLAANPIYPACLKNDNVVAVGATERNDAWAGFSNYSITLADLGAPGRDILSTKRGGGYENRTGTSQAAPLVAASAALLYAKLQEQGLLADTSVDATRVKKALLEGVDWLAALTGKCASGGRLNAAKAIRGLP